MLDGFNGNGGDFLVVHSLLSGDQDDPREIPLFGSKIILFYPRKGNLLSRNRIELVLFERGKNFNGHRQSGQRR